MCFPWRESPVKTEAAREGASNEKGLSICCHRDGQFCFDAISRGARRLAFVFFIVAFFRDVAELLGAVAQLLRVWPELFQRGVEVLFGVPCLFDV